MAESRIMTCRHPFITQLLAALGVDNEVTSRVVIDIPASGVVTVTVTEFARCMPGAPPMPDTNTYNLVPAKESDGSAVNPHMSDPPGDE